MCVCEREERERAFVRPKHREWDARVRNRPCGVLWYACPLFFFSLCNTRVERFRPFFSCLDLCTEKFLQNGEKWVVCLVRG